MKHPRLTQIFLDAIWKKRGPGYFVEIGAFEGAKKNSTIILENKGWQGVCVEPTPESFKKLTQNRKCRCENVAIWKEEGSIEFANYKEKPAWNGIVETLDEYHQKRIDMATTKIKRIFSYGTNNAHFLNHRNPNDRPQVYIKTFLYQA